MELTRERVNNMPLEAIMAMHNAWLKQQKHQSSQQAGGKFSRDGVMPVIDFRKKPEKDDGVNQLHGARFQRMPLSDPKNWYHKVPQVLEPVMINAIPLKISGSQNQVPPHVIEKLHDRTKSCKLTDFYIGKFGSGSKTSEFQDTNWDTCVAVFQIQEAFGNYQGLIQQMFPYDHTPVTIYRVLVKFHWCKMVIIIKKRIAVICCFFEDVMKDNANRAVNDLEPLDYTGVENMLVNRIQKAGVPATIPLMIDAEPQDEKPQNNSGGNTSGYRGRGGGRGGRGGRGRGRGRGRGGRGGNNGGDKKKFATAKAEGLRTCFDYNNKAKCENKSVGNNKCEAEDGEWFIHKCNVYIDEKDTHCLMNHSCREHYRITTGAK